MYTLVKMGVSVIFIINEASGLALLSFLGALMCGMSSLAIYKSYTLDIVKYYKGKVKRPWSLIIFEGLTTLLLILGIVISIIDNI
jgi:hypothetical protein